MCIIGHFCLTIIGVFWLTRGGYFLLTRTKLYFKEGTYILYIVINRKEYITEPFELNEHKIIEITDYKKDIWYKIRSDYSYRSVDANKYENIEKAELRN